jgi:hypothetical protein
MPLKVGERRGTSFLQISRLQARQERDAAEKVAESAKDFNWKGIIFQPHHPRTTLSLGATKQNIATTAASAALSCTGLPLPRGRNVCPASLEPQPAKPSQSVQAPNANSSCQNMFTAVATIFQQIMTELNGAGREENRIMFITKIVAKLIKQNGR